MKTGKHSVVIGAVPDDSTIGEGSVVIGATDARRNTIINTPMAVGFGAKAGPDSIAIGAFAGAGLRDLSFPLPLREDMGELVALAVRAQNQPLIDAIERLATELRQPQPKRGAILRIWESVTRLADIDGAASLLERLSATMVAHAAQLGA